MSPRLHVAVVTFDLIMEGNESLKDKRRILHSVKERLSHRLNVTVAEIGEKEVYQSETIAIGCVGSDRRRIEQTLQKARNSVERRHDAEVWNWHMEWR